MSFAKLGGVAALLLTSHEIGDQWVQTHHQALTKGRPGWDGRLACARHVAGITAAHGLALAAGCAVTRDRLRPGRVAAGLAIIAVSHYWADRRTTLAQLAERIGKGEYYRLGSPRPDRDDNVTTGTGAYQLDQAWHAGWIAVAACIIAR